jgi:2-polyprenyl-3-methyl-5-hydroxy-6-metoxy-1,4-benzoquinol methylase
MLLSDRLAARIRDNLAWEALHSPTNPERAAVPESPVPRLRRVWPLPNEEFVHGVYQILLGRVADAIGLADRVRLLKAGIPRTEIVRQIASAEESTRRNGSPHWLHELARLTPDGVFAALLDLWHRPAAEFVRGAYDLLLQRPADPDGLSTSLGWLADGGLRADLVRAIAASPEFAATGAESSWVPRLRLLTPDGLRNRLVCLLSEPDAAFVRGLYAAVLHRTPTPEELSRDADALGRQVPRTDLIRHQLTCPDARGRYAGPVWEDALRPLIAPRAAAQAGAAGDSAAGFGDRLDRLTALTAEWAASAEIGRSRPLIEDLYRGLAACREQLAAVSRTAARLPDGLGKQLDRIEATAHKPSAPEEVVGELAELRTAVRGLAAGLRKLRKAVPRMRKIGRQVLDVQHRLLTEQPQADADRRETVEALRRLAESQQKLADAHARLAGGVHELTVSQQTIRGELTHDRLVVAAGFDQLRRIGASLAEQVGATVGPDAPDGPPAARSDRCRVCGGDLQFKWSARVMNDKYEAEYHECRSCQALQIPDPIWLAEAYRHEADPLLWNPDTGRFRRNFTVFCYLKAMADAGLPAARVLDYGGGYGLLTQMLADAGVDAWTHDPFVANPFFATERVIPSLETLPDRTFDVVTAFEVFEHLTDPAAVGAEFRRLLRPGGAVVISTTLYEPGTHGPDWFYLSRAAGQHVLFWSRGAMRAFAARFGFASVGYFPTDGFPCVVLADRPATDLSAALTRLDERLWDEPFFRTAAGEWLLANRPAAAPAADVVAIEPHPGGAPCAS